MKFGNAERDKYAAHIELAARHGVSSDMPLKVETSFFLPHVGSGEAAVVEIHVSMEVSIRIIAEGHGVERLGDVSWRNYHGYSDPFRRAAYYKVDGDVPRVVRSPSVGKDGNVPLAATDPFQLAKFLIEQCAQEIKGLSEETGTKLRDAVRALVETRVRDGLTAAPLIVGRDGKVTMVRLADVPHYVVVESPYGGKGVDAAYWDVVVDRPRDFDALNWQGIGLRFEPWETDVAGKVLRSFGIDSTPPTYARIDFPSDAASDLAVANRCAMNALLPHFIKKVMLDLSSSELGKTSTVQAHTKAVYGAVARGEWGSEELDAAFDALHDLWTYSAPFSELSRTKGWTCKLSPFEVMKARVDAFPWRGVVPVAAVETTAAPAP
ncbi:hypothetical protein [Rhizobium sp. BK176]|uniref:hypothetical protein n=1 Tax=Rhizobium sp. BK176 TaxID=2587071 RepID=UPI00216AA3F0|nr:hypothetical protein [Rhizobium sp. BK176]MCS4088893.1 hypothetical protein [Rhizobium sp. BK176]